MAVEDPMKKTGLRIAQVGAVALALGVSAWIVVLAHREANPDKPTPTSTPGADGEAEGFEQEAGPEEEDPNFMFSSKSAIGIAPKGEKANEPKKKPVFLPSSKSLPMNESFLEKDNDEAAKAKAKDAAKKEPIFIGGSKSESGAVSELLRKEIEALRRKKAAAEKAAAAKKAAEQRKQQGNR